MAPGPMVRAQYFGSYITLRTWRTCQEKVLTPSCLPSLCSHILSHTQANLSGFSGPECGQQTTLPVGMF